MATRFRADVVDRVVPACARIVPSPLVAHRLTHFAAQITGNRDIQRGNVFAVRIIMQRSRGVLDEGTLESLRKLQPDGGADCLAQLTTVFIEDGSTRLADLRAGVDACEDVRVRRAAHSLTKHVGRAWRDGDGRPVFATGAPGGDAAFADLRSATVNQVDLLALANIRLIDRPALAEASPPALPELEPLRQRSTVLIVDDDRPVLSLLERVLQFDNYEILTADSGADALQKARAHGKTIDLLITDYAMSGMHGRQLAATLRQEIGGLAVLYQTGHSDMLFADQAELEERAAFLEKPYSGRGIREAARLVLFGAVNPS